MTNSNPLEGPNGQLMVLASTRYCLGRQSYIVGCCQEFLTANWQLLDDNTAATIIRDIVEALMDGEAGDSYDYKSWQKFAYLRWRELSEKQCEWIESSVAHKKKEWPL